MLVQSSFNHSSSSSCSCLHGLQPSHIADCFIVSSQPNRKWTLNNGCEGQSTRNATCASCVSGQVLRVSSWPTSCKDTSQITACKCMRRIPRCQALGSRTGTRGKSVEPKVPTAGTMRSSPHGCGPPSANQSICRTLLIRF